MAHQTISQNQINIVLETILTNSNVVDHIGVKTDEKGTLNYLLDEVEKKISRGKGLARIALGSTQRVKATLFILKSK